MNYGLPYMGSKNLIAKTLIDALPAATTFVDLFAGGCAMTHAAMLSNKYQNFIANDLSDTPQLFLDCIAGKYANEQRWISREDFQALKDSDPYVRYVWSFGNNGQDYMYSREVEPWKKALHYARVLGDPSLLREFGIDSDGSREDVRMHHYTYKIKYVRWYVENVIGKQFDDTLIRDLEGKIAEQSEELRLYLVKARDDAGLTSSDVDRLLGTNGMAGHYFGKSQWEFPTRENYDIMRSAMPSLVDFDEVYGYADLLQRMQILQSLERLERMQRMQRMQRLEVTRLDYRAVKIPAGSVVYADPPYRGTSGYVCGDFDHDAFYAWCMAQPFDVYVSEYSMPASFHEVLTIPHRSRLSGTAKNAVVERLYCNHTRHLFGQLDFLGQLFAEAV